MRLLSLTLLLGLLLLPAWAASEPPSELQAAYRSYSDAWEALSLDRVLQLYTQDAQMLDGRGSTLERKEIEANLRETLKDARACKIQCDLLEYRPADQKAVVKVHQTRTIDYGSKRVWRVVDRLDTWKLTAQGWRLRYIQVLSQSATVTTGEPLPRPSVPGASPPR